MFNRHLDREQNPANMYPQDLELIASVSQGISQGIVVQLSTFAANDDNSQKDVVEEVSS
jgi:hypothetical protein